MDDRNVGSKGHEYIKKLRKEFGIAEEKTTKEEDDYERRYREARAKRVEEAGYIDRYVELFNRDYWTDKWLGPGPDPGLQYMETAPGDKKIEQKEWRDKYVPKHVPNLSMQVRESKAVKKARKKRKEQELEATRQKKYDLVYWWLEVYLKPKYAYAIYQQYAGRVDDMVDDIYEQASSWISYINRGQNLDHELTIDEVMARTEERAIDERETVVDVGGMKFKRLETAERKRREYNTDWYEDRYPDIPDEYWDEFDTWADKHPLKNYKKKAKRLGYGWKASAAGLRRLDFLKKINKRNKGFRKNIMKSGMNLFDPVTGQSFVSEKKMKNYIDKRMRRYDEKRKEFVKLLDGLVKDGKISEDMAIGWMSDTKEARDRVKQRYKSMRERIEEGQKRYGKRKDTREHDAKYMKEREEWFRKFGSDPTDTPFTLSFDGEETRVENIAKPGKRPVWKFDRRSRGITDYIESS